MDDRDSDGGWSEIDPGGGFRVSEELQNELSDYLRIKSSARARLVANAVEEAIRAYRMERSVPIKKEREAFRRMRRGLREVSTELARLSPNARFALLTHYEGRGRSSYREVISILEELERAAILCEEGFRGDPKDERRGHERDLVAALVEVSETYYPSELPRRGRGINFRRDTILFIRRCLEAAGVSKIPSDEMLYRRYIMPAQKWVRERNAELASRHEKDPDTG